MNIFGPSSVRQLVLAGCVLCACAHAPEPNPTPGAIAEAVTEVCGRDIVLLGEDGSHGAGGAMRARAELVMALIDRCGFDAVVFETGLYDFLRGGPMDEASLTRALPLWAPTEEFEGLLRLLVAREAEGRVLLSAMDDQFNRGTYAATEMPEELVRLLAEPRRAECHTAFERHRTWAYGDEHPWDTKMADELLECWRAVEANARRARAELRAEMARHAVIMLSRERAQLAGATQAAGIAARDRAMFETFEEFLAAQAKPKKVIIWTANSHAGKTSLPGALPSFGTLVHERHGARVASIACSALSGAYGRSRVAQIPRSTDSLEARGFADTRADVRYLSARELKAAGTIAAHPFSFATLDTYDWSRVFDGYLLLRTEAPPHFRAK